MAIQKPSDVSRSGERRKKILGDRTYSVARALIFGVVACVIFAVLCFLAKQWGAGIFFLVAAAGAYFPIKYIYRFPSLAYALEEEGITVYETNDKTTFIPFTNIKRVTVFNPDLGSTFLFSSRRSIFITLKPVGDEEDGVVVRIFFPYDPEAVYFQILKAKLDFDGVPADR
jgi:hypothetical protein